MLRFSPYSYRFNKTASLMAYSCKAVAIIAVDQNRLERRSGSGANGNIDVTEPSKGELDLVHLAYEYGKNLGIAFQLVDDWLDFSADAQQLGKPAAADLK